MICDDFQATGTHDAALDLSDLFHVSLQGDDILDFDTRWDQALLSASEVPKENVLQSLYKMKIHESVQLQTVLAMHNQEFDRDRAVPSYQRLKTDDDQMVRNFGARNERIGAEVSVKSQKGRVSVLR